MPDGRWNLPPGLARPTRSTGGVKVRVDSLLVQEGRAGVRWAEGQTRRQPGGLRRGADLDRTRPLSRRARRAPLDPSPAAQANRSSRGSSTALRDRRPARDHGRRLPDGGRLRHGSWRPAPSRISRIRGSASSSRASVTVARGRARLPFRARLRGRRVGACAARGPARGAASG